MRNLLTIVFAVLLSFCLADDPVDPTINAKLILVVETFRHGARYRIYNSSYYDGEGVNYGELTAEGERMHYVLGQTLQQKYAGTNIQFPFTYDHTFIWAKSTNVNRTIMSAQSQLAGMFPLGLGLDVSAVNNEFLVPPYPNLNLNGLDKFSLPKGQQPVAIHVKEQKDEKQLLGYSDACYNARAWSNANVNDTDWLRIQGEFQETINTLAAIPELELPANPDMQTIAQLVDTLIAIKWQDIGSQNTKLSALIDGFEMTYDQMMDPQNKNNLWVRMNLLYTIQLNLALFKTNQQKHTSVTPYFNELLAYFNNALNTQNYFKWIMLSAHDTTISMVSQGMNFTSWECMEAYGNGTLAAGSTCLFTYPGFASNIIYELYQDTNNKPFIKALYNGTEMALCNTQLTYCYLDTFTDIINNFVVADFDQECGNITTAPSATSNDDNDSTPTWAIVVIIVIGVLLACSIAYIFVQRKKYNQMLQQDKLSTYSKMA